MAEDTAQPTPTLTPLAPRDDWADWVPGKYASFPVSPEPMFGPDELGEYKSAIDDMDETVTRADSAARIFEVMQAAEAQLFSRGYHFLNSSRNGWSLYGRVNGARASGQEILQTHNAGKLFSCNVYSARQDKINSILAVDVPGLTFVPKRDADPMDQEAADEAKKYLKVWLNDAGIKEIVGEISDLFYTDDRVVLYTRSVADEQEWETETPDAPQVASGAPEQEGEAPETENEKEPVTKEVPAVKEITTTHGKLEAKVPIAANNQRSMPWIRLMSEENANTLKERYPWIADKIKGGGTSGKDQIDRQMRILVRLAVQTSSSSGESWQQDATETFTWYRPSHYRSIKKDDVRKVFKENFPDGLLVVHAAGEFAFCRNESLNKHLKVIHAKKGPGQNRRAIGTNYLPLQKILNAEISLVDRQFRSAIARRFHNSERINSETLNGQMNDPAKSTPVLVQNANEKISDFTAVENIAPVNTSIMEFVQWLIQGAPEAMDGGEPAMFGAQTGENDQGVYQTAKLKRDAARGIYAVPWAQICIGLAKAVEQAVQCAAKNRITSIRSNIPGQGKLEIELGKLQGDALCYPESMDIPQTIAEQEAQMAELLENGKNIAIYQAIATDPRNLTVFANFPSLSGLEIPGLDSVEQQQGEFELLLQSGPLDNPQLAQIQKQIQEGQTHPEAQTPEGQQAMQQLQQMEQQLPPKVSSVPVAQDGSENHQIHAQIVLGLVTSPEGRKLKNGDPQQQAIYQNLMLHWKEHVEMSQKLTPPKEMEFKGSMTVDPSKYGPEVQSKIFQAAGLQVSPEEATDTHELVPHEVTTEKEGVDEQGVPVKQKIAMVNPGGKLG
jgi:hypothetical protein